METMQVGHNIGGLHWKAAWARVRNSPRDGTGRPCFLVSANAAEVTVQVAGECRTYACDTDLLQRALANAEEAWGIEPPVEVDAEQRILMVFSPIEASLQDLGAGGRMTAIPLFEPTDQGAASG